MTTRRAAWASEMYIPTTNIREGDNGGRRRRRGKTFSEIGWLWLFDGLAFGSCFPPLRLKGSSLGLALQRLREGTEAAKTSPPPAEAEAMSLAPLSTLEASPDQVFTHVFLVHKFRTLVSDARSYQLPSSSLDFFSLPLRLAKSSLFLSLLRFGGRRKFNRKSRSYCTPSSLPYSSPVRGFLPL